MFKYFNKKTVLSVITFLSLLLVVQVVYAISSEPGSQGDPLVTMSYVDQRMEQMQFYIDEKVAGAERNITASTFEVIEVKAGQTLIAGKGTELIIRGGKATAITSALGGLSDITAARDIQSGETVPANHLIIVPRDDGRGIKATTDLFIMIKGVFSIEN
ncbi:MAG: hypothetical protein LR001_06685 [Clostridiales bacterium]|nr:hypothetical protein [Clostridiales bacterium]